METLKKRYILANIKIPIEIRDDDSIDTLPDYMTIIFENLNELPKPSENDYNNEYIKRKIKSLLLSDENEYFDSKIEPAENNEMNEENPKEQNSIITEGSIITEDELKNRIIRTHNKNLTFKNKKTSVSRYTAKNYL
jgi:hypothetical protein